MDEMERTTAGHDVEHDERMALQAEIQDVLETLQREMAGDSVEDVVIAINRRLADDGIAEQPHRWVLAMAERISTGRPVVADTAAAVDAIRLTASGEDDDPGLIESVAAPQDADGDPAHDPSERSGGPAAGPLPGDTTAAEPESVEPGAVPESQATPPRANPR